MTKILTPENIDDLCRSYGSGSLESDLSKKFGVTYQAIHRWLVKRDIPLRSISESHRIASARASKEERARRATAAHDAVRGKRQTLEHRCKIAKSIEKNPIMANRDEIMCAAALEERGFQCTIFKAIGKYNVDIAIAEPSIAVEIFGGYWHTTPRHAARYRKRFDYLLNCGWLPIIIWTSTIVPLGPGAIEYIVALAEKIRRGESIGRQEQMILGNGKPSAIGKRKLNNLTPIQGPTPRNNSTGRYTSRPG
jgi:very-short-patch-repair endonuclease